MRGARGVSAGEAFQAINDAVEFVGVTRQSLRKGVEVRDGSAKRVGVVSQDAIESSQRVACGAGHALTGRRVGSQRGQVPQDALAPAFSGRAAALQTSPPERRSGPGNPVRPSCPRAPACPRPTATVAVNHGSDCCVSSSRCGHLADADSVEKNRGAGQQARHRVLEVHPIDGALGQACLLLCHQ